MDWFIDPNRQGSMAAWAAEHGVTDRAVIQWRQHDGWKKELQRRADKLNVNPERVQSVVNAIFKKACDGDMKAAQLYLQYTDRFTPTTRRVVEERTPDKLTDAELAAALGKNVTPITQAREAVNG
jgi:hypothetical protein